jgi:hydroxymethylpyrimidine/phosphomethylpyrimidine kinase
VFADFAVAGVKLGMLATAEVIHLVADALEQHSPSFVVVDPVMVATSGARLLESDALDALRTRLFPLATILTPNIPEAELLLGHAIVDDESADCALDELLALGARAILLKGGHMPTRGELVDRLASGVTRVRYVHQRLDVEGHGTGCTLASAIAAALALGNDLSAACKGAADYVHGALQNAYFPGNSELAVLDHGWRRSTAGSVR